MTAAFRSFLRTLAANSALLRAPTPPPLTLVLGNESADLDSMVSSLALAYDLSTKTPHPVVPIINTPRADLVLRPECSLLLSHTLEAAGASLSSLTFIDDVDLARHPMDIWLVDHNAPASRQAFLEPYVHGIVDHHVDEGKCLGAKERQIEVVASCATLVAQRLGPLVDPDLAKLLIAPILIDSSNLNPAAKRATPSDIACVQWLSSLVQWASPQQPSTALTTATLDVSSPDDLYKTLDSLKGMVTHLSPYDLLRKDYKQWQVADANGKAWALGISSISFPLKKWMKRDGPLIEQAIGHWIAHQNLDMALVMTHGKTKENGIKVYGRQLILAFSPDIKEGQMVVDKLVDVEVLGLQLLEKTSGAWWFTQSRSESSRKQVFPAVKQLIEGLDFS
ncbi:Exopolyphosphatase [Coemansia spiralis]|uniref:Exopolyphosphatase n=1 Tax=Coemansia spiralis TaxID=417178 RepID=A0A9W8GJP9_9FUNG|nr:Exopolyphosphatase [Coemansia spiralis]